MQAVKSLKTLALLSLLAAFQANADGPFYGDPPDANHPWGIHDPNRPQPARVEVSDTPGAPPSDAIVLFDGTEKGLANWESDRQHPDPEKFWILNDGTLQCVPGAGGIRSKQHFGDCQLHVEWTAPFPVKGSSQGRGNSGIFLMGMTEVQVLDNYNNPTYADGFAGSIYGVNPPMANSLRPPKQWNTYDIIFRRPVHKDGKEVDPGYMTVFINGVLVQDHTPLEGGGGHHGRSKSKVFPEQGPLKLQDHGNNVRYRNIWYRPLPPRAVEGGTNGYLSEEATMAKRAAIAAEIREDAVKLKGNAKMLRMMESLYYQKHQKTNDSVLTMVRAYANAAPKLAANKGDDAKGEIMQMHRAVQYLVRHGFWAEGFQPLAALEAVAIEKERVKKK